MSTLLRLIMLVILTILLVWNGKLLAQSANVIDGTSAKLRADATRHGAVIALLAAGTRVEVSEARGDYVRVNVAGTNGWVAQRLLSMQAQPQAAPESSAPQVAELRRQESRNRQIDFALIHEEQEKNTWRMLATTIAVAMAAFIGGFWLRGVIFRHRYGWLSTGSCYRLGRKRIL